MSGMILVKDRGRDHRISLIGGAIADVEMDDSTMNHLRRGDPFLMHSRAARLFELPRPHVTWEPGIDSGHRRELVDPVRVVLSGITGRRDLFEPRRLWERIPVASLSLSGDKLEALRRLPFTREEKTFLSRLEVPTPIPMIIWKRGLDPRHAGSLLVALNLLGVWKEEWEPGLLPRNSMAVEVLRAMATGVDDLELLGLEQSSTEEEVDRAFRRLSLLLHPDRMGHLPSTEARMAQEAFGGVSSAYSRLKRSRRSRPVRVPGEQVIARVNLSRKAPDTWMQTFEEATRSARNGNVARARAFALKSLGLDPPEEVRERIRQFLSRVA